MKLSMTLLTSLAVSAALMPTMVSAASGKPAHASSQMDKALAALREAQEALEKANSDKGGHRKIAMQNINTAIQEVQAGIAYSISH